jgi:hypothetical protein
MSTEYELVLFGTRARRPSPPHLPSTVDDALAQVKRGDAPGVYLLTQGTWMPVHDERHLRTPERLVALTAAHPARVFVEASRGVARLPVNAVARRLLDVDVRGPVCVLAPISRPPLPPPDAPCVKPVPSKPTSIPCPPYLAEW